jgi:hypothetical protein
MMNIDSIISIAPLISFCIIGTFAYLSWRKKGQRLALWYFYLVLLGSCISLSRILVNDIFHLTGRFAHSLAGVSIVLDLVLLMLCFLLPSIEKATSKYRN